MASSPETTSSVVRKARPSDVDTLAQVLADAFDNDPVLRHILPSDHYRQRLTSLFTFEANLGIRGTWVAVDDGQITGAALWELPGHEAAGPVAFLRHSPHLIRAFGTSLPSAQRTVQIIRRARPTRIPHWYLHTIGAARPGLGIGGRLLRDGLSRADAMGLPAYLESSAPQNVALYERYGFRAFDEIPLPDGPTLTTMWRRPQR